MTATSTVRKSSVKTIAVTVDEGTSLREAIQDALVAGLQTEAPGVLLLHNDKQYLIHMDSLVRLVATQSALITGKHKVN